MDEQQKQKAALQQLERLMQRTDKLIEKAKANPKAFLAKAREVISKTTFEEVQEYINDLIMISKEMEDTETNKQLKKRLGEIKGDREGVSLFLRIKVEEYRVAAQRAGLDWTSIEDLIKLKTFELIPDHGITLQGVLPNAIRQVGKRAREIVDDAFIFDSENVSIAFLDASKYGVATTVPMQKVLSMLHEELCKILPTSIEALGKVTLDELDKYTDVQISLDKYMELTGTKDKKTARETVKEATERLFNSSFRCTVGKNKYAGHLFQTKATIFRGGIFKMSFTNKYIRCCSTTSIATFHRGMYKINGHNNPYAWGIGQKLWQHFMQTRGKKGNGRLKVANILLAVQDIPDYEEVMKKDRHWTKKIVTPVERDLDELIRLGVLKSWEYCNAKGAVLTKEQLWEGWSFRTWAKLYIAYELDLPPQDTYIMKHKEKREEAKKREEARQKRIARLVEAKTVAKIAKEK